MISRLLICLCIVATLNFSDARADVPLFSSHAMMEMTIPLDFKTLCRPREMPDCDYTPTVLEYINEQGQARSIDIEIKIRGGWRSLTRNCSAPLLFIRFNEQQTAGTPFEGQSLLPLTTHCGQGLSLESSRVKQSHVTWEQYLLKEYLAHRLYNAITDISALSGPHPNLHTLILMNNTDLSNIQPLLDNTEFGTGDYVDLNNTSVSCDDVALLEAKGLTVAHTCS